MWGGDGLVVLSLDYCQCSGDPGLNPATAVVEFEFNFLKIWNEESTDGHETIVDCWKNPSGSLTSFREGNLLSLPGLVYM